MTFELQIVGSTHHPGIWHPWLGLHIACPIKPKNPKSGDQETKGYPNLSHIVISRPSVLGLLHQIGQTGKKSPYGPSLKHEKNHTFWSSTQRPWGIWSIFTHRMHTWVLTSTQLSAPKPSCWLFKNEKNEIFGFWPFPCSIVRKVHLLLCYNEVKAISQSCSLI